MTGKAEEIRAVVAELDGLLDALRENAAALNAILVPPGGNGDASAPPDDAKEMV